MALAPENTPSNVNTILFLGAGASAIFGYPKSNEFIEKIKEGEETKKLVERLESLDCKTIDDIVRELRDFIPRESEGKLLEDALREEKKEIRDEVQNQLQTQTLLNNSEKEKKDENIERLGNTIIQKGDKVKEWWSIGRDVLENIISNIYKEFSPNVHLLEKENRNHLKRYIELLREINKNQIPVFTTNYDPVIESLEDEYYVNTLFEKEKWDLRYWKGADAFETRENMINLFKLHGSIYWKWDSGKLTEERTKQRRPLSPLSEEEREIIAPGTTVGSDRQREPYFTYYEYLEEYLGMADNCIVVGFRFDDRDIKEIFKRHMDNLTIILVHPRAEKIKNDNFGNHNNVVAVSGRMEEEETISKVREVLEGKYVESISREKGEVLFEDSLQKPNSGDSWEIIKGDNWTFTEEGYQFTGGGGCNTSLIKDLKLKNGIIEVEANSVDGRGGQHIVFRSDNKKPAGNCYRLGSISIGDNPQSHFWVIQDEKGRRDERDDIPVELKANKFHKYRVEIREGSFTMYIDGNKVIEKEDETLKNAGYIGLHCGSNTIFRNIKVIKA